MHALVGYSSSSSDSVEDEDVCHIAKRHKAESPQQPASSVVPFPNVEDTDKKELASIAATDSHQGRKRCFEHEDGNWPVSLLLQVDSNRKLRQDLRDLHDLLEQRVAGVQWCERDDIVMADHQMDRNTRSKLGENYHVSLSHVQPAAYAQKKPLIQALRRAADKWKHRSLTLPRLEVYLNAQATRTFLAADVEDGKGAIIDAISRLDAVLPRFRLQPFFVQPRPHISLFWWLGDVRCQLEAVLPELQARWHTCIGKWTVKTTKMVCMFGHEEHELAQS